MLRSFTSHIKHLKYSSSINTINRSTRSISFQSEYGLFIDGTFVKPEGLSKFSVEAPATGEHLCDVYSADEKIVNIACNTAQETFEDGVWSRIDVRERAKVMNNIAVLLRENIPHLAEMEVAQTGRAVREMKAQLARLPEWFEYFSALIRTHEGMCM